MKKPVSFAMLLALLFGLASTLQAADHFLTIGGGYSPTGNQISLEKNTQWFQQILNQRYSDAPHAIYFADGNDGGRDLQYNDPKFVVPRAHLLLARVMRQTKYLSYQYRNHQVSPVRGVSSPENVKKWFAEDGKKLKAGDRLIIYVTAHGGRSTDKKNAYNTTLYFWNRKKMLMKEFVAQLDTLPKGVSVATVMVQCYAGGYANFIFNEGDKAKGATKADRCGFFATVHNRVAAGCTPDISEDNYYEYSSYFWAAMDGKTRTGKPVTGCDYNGDGNVSFDEAHAYALLTSNTIDISIKTSDTFLRAFSKLKHDKPAGKKQPAKKPAKKPVQPAKKKPEKKKADSPQNCQADVAAAGGKKEKVEEKPKADPAKKPADKPKAEAKPIEVAKPKQPAKPKQQAKPVVLLTADTPYAQLLALASPSERAVLEGLSAELKLTKPKRAFEAKALAARLMKEKSKLNTEYKKVAGRYNSAASEIRKAVINRWPEISNRWHPVTNELLTKEAGALVKLIESHGKFKEFDKLYGELKKRSAGKLDSDRRWVKCQRLIRTLENVALAANLPKVASSEIQERYKKLLAAEAGTWGKGSKPVTAATAATGK